MRPVEVQAPTTPNAHWGALQTTWERRSVMAAEWLQDARIVADAGCGLMTLEALLAPSTTYIPMDVVARDGRTIVFDFNREPIPVVTCDAMVMLGVLEYSDDVASIFSQLRQFPRVVFSYNHVSVNDVLWRLGLRTKYVTWRNRHTRASLRRLLAASHMRIVRERRIRFGERLYEVVSH